MSITSQILGNPGRDNAAFITIYSGQAVHQLLFDCGENCLSGLPISTIMEIEHLLFSHFHMDHISGLDSFIRLNYSRTSRPNHIWGPKNTGEIIQHRFQGFWWNLTNGAPGQWHLHSIHPQAIETQTLRNCEQFRIAHPSPTRFYERTIIEHADFTVEAKLLDHHGPSVAYLVKEKPRLNLDTRQLQALGLRPGPWIQRVKDPSDDGQLEIGGELWNLAELREKLLVETPGESAAYLTDFLLDETTHTDLVQWLRGCETLICESQYCHSDLQLALKNYHSTATLVAKLACDAQVKKLTLFHLSDRYSMEQWREMLEEAGQFFPEAQFPQHWQI